ncbi:unnamed protein product [Paramecium primaurelia]|uniref:Uncharacterized protein n=1 Tax=Paramecium primaurelia TaxID=5886 RepID=A0A8S1LYR7_PARPR|nr:unnamed protein product [Paramecium primaurelia]
MFFQKKDCFNNQDIYLFIVLLVCLKSQNSKKPILKITLDMMSGASFCKLDNPPSFKYSQMIVSSNNKTTTSSKKQSLKFQVIFSYINPSIFYEGEKKCKFGLIYN